MIHIAIVADYDPDNPTHLATQDAIAHSAASIGVQTDCRWVATDELGQNVVASQLSEYNAIFIGPASPYRNKEAVIQAIQYGRENRIPLIGTCGGFQHIILEWARHVMGFVDAEHAEYDPYASRLFLTRLPCSLVGKTLKIQLMPDSVAGRAYGQSHADERYYCNFGLNEAYRGELQSSGIKITGIEAGEADAQGAVRIVEVADHPFFVGTLFVPQTRSSAASPHPLITEFLRSAATSQASFRRAP
jgi:CTP synthase (UTP-ammonia lyase)